MGWSSSKTLEKADWSLASSTSQLSGVTGQRGGCVVGEYLHSENEEQMVHIWALVFRRIVYEPGTDFPLREKYNNTKAIFHSRRNLEIANYKKYYT